MMHSLTTIAVQHATVAAITLHTLQAISQFVVLLDEDDDDKLIPGFKRDKTVHHRVHQINLHGLRPHIHLGEFSE
jgi:hypothetical protein